MRLLKLSTSDLEIVLSHSLLRFVVQCNCFLVLHSRRSDLSAQRCHCDRANICVSQFDALTQCYAKKRNRSKRIDDNGCSTVPAVRLRPPSQRSQRPPCFGKQDCVPVALGYFQEHNVTKTLSNATGCNSLTQLSVGLFRNQTAGMTKMGSKCSESSIGVVTFDGIQYLQSHCATPDSV